MADLVWTLPPGLPRDDRPTVVTVGTFDGVHRGHMEVLDVVSDRADRLGGRSVLVTFHPHPLRIVRPEVAPRLLTTPDEKKEILAESGLDYAVFLEFTPQLRQYPPERFVTEIVRDRLSMDELVIGYDHGFGRGRSGDVDTLKGIAAREGFQVSVVEEVRTKGGGISSSAIRRALDEGRIRDANRALGRPYSLTGVVVRGEGRGRHLGFPTANLHIGTADKLVPPPGIYAVFGVLRRGRYLGALHVGPRPTFRGSPPTIELFLMDFDGDLYGDVVRVDFIEYLRGVAPFESVEALVDQMTQDVAQARDILESYGSGEKDGA